ncbi:L-2-amino-thiazoline-4-carboxylic acid hydrolase [Bradyrhizobium sp. WSM3983]|uniref:L-2-amino-thiazoline-4-carboxylic acid hydrolase n=1 Tax=Bradyrhizobium sp. WSM3983 TaxID=1038867 RepID=UPI00048036B8|nr:L-2-amino-thiazoline-4-carboxylic acid hydrolase [Bradyrhizobium sp. WSM3983]
MSMSVIEQAKIQAQVLVPLVKALQAELGEARANALVRKTLGDLYRRFGVEFWTAKNEANLGQAVACTANFATAEGFGPDIRLTRTQTIMQGADHCDFRYRRVADQSKGRQSE